MNQSSRMLRRISDRKRGRWWSAVVIALPVAVALGVVPSAARAEEASPDPLWYVDAMRIDAIHDAGITGEGVTVAVFDSKMSPSFVGFRNAEIEVQVVEDCADPTADIVPGLEDSDSHGTAVTSLLVGDGESENGRGPLGIAPNVRVLYYGVLEGCEGRPFAKALKSAVAEGADIVTFSGAFQKITDELSEDSVASVSAALGTGVIIVSSLRNPTDSWDSELTTMNGVVNVAAVDSAAQPAIDVSGAPMRYEDVDVVAPGVDVAGVGFDGTWGLSSWSGTSAATPIVAGVLALAKQKWPDATSNQLLQSLIRNTGSEPHELAWGDALGHGVVNATRMMEEDPSQYPDENPLFKDDQLPAYDDVYPEPEPTATPTAVADDGLSVLPWAVGGGIVIALGILLTVVLVRVRRSRRPAGAPSLR